MHFSNIACLNFMYVMLLLNSEGLTWLLVSCDCCLPKGRRILCVCVCLFVRSQTVKGSTQKPQGVWTSPSKNQNMCHSCFCVPQMQLKQQNLHARSKCAHNAVSVLLALYLSIRGGISVIYCVNKELPSVLFTRKDWVWYKTWCLQRKWIHLSAKIIGGVCQDRHHHYYCLYLILKVRSNPSPLVLNFNT